MVAGMGGPVYVVRWPGWDSVIKSLILKVVRALGYELRPRNGRGTLSGVLRCLRDNGFRPAGVVDVGAAYGDFTIACHTVFPESRFLMVEPLEEYSSYLRDTLARLTSGDVMIVAAASEAGELTINVHPDLVGSSVYFENEGKEVDGLPRRVPAETLDGLSHEKGLRPPYLIKLDVQGAELQVLEGATEVLHGAGAVILETSFLPFFNGGPLFDELVAAMRARGFVVYDIFGLTQRPLDGALAQVDVVFVPIDSPLRRDGRYATSEQRRVLTDRLRRRFDRS